MELASESCKTTLGFITPTIRPMVELSLRRMRRTGYYYFRNRKNPDRQGKWIKAHLVLPEGFNVEDVDNNTPALLEPFSIESDHINVFVNEDGLVEIEAAFNRAAFCEAGVNDKAIEARVIGSFTNGEYFFGTDTIRIINGGLSYVAVLASHWLEVGCGVPDWCGGVDVDHSSTVDFVDFALFDGCCIEVVGE